jgi:methionine-rich copper-binding protein CopC
MKHILIGCLAAALAAPAVAAAQDSQAPHQMDHGAMAHGAAAGPGADHSKMDHSAMAAHGPMRMGGMLKSSVPADDETVPTPPEVLTLTFVHPMVLEYAILLGTSDRTIRLPTSGASTDVAKVKLPPLKSGDYKIAWVSRGEGVGHKASGVIAFTVK